MVRLALENVYKGFLTGQPSWIAKTQSYGGPPFGIALRVLYMAFSKKCLGVPREEPQGSVFSTHSSLSQEAIHTWYYARFSAVGRLPFLVNLVDYQKVNETTARKQSSAVWLSFWCSTRRSGDTGTNYNLLHYHY